MQNYNKEYLINEIYLLKGNTYKNPKIINNKNINIIYKISKLKKTIFIFKKYCKFLKIIKILIIYFCLVFLHLSITIKNKKKYVWLKKHIKKTQKGKNNLNIALCTMAKEENLYLNEFIDYYIKLGINHIFIYDDNDPNFQKMTDILDNKYKKNITIYESIQNKIKDQATAFNDCYNKNKNMFDWFLMVDMDEFLYLIKDNSLKDYLSNKIFDKCDFIKFTWAQSLDNNLIHYDNRSLFERFKPPYLKAKFVKTIIRGNISDLKYWVHSPYYSPLRNISCLNNGKQILKNKINIESIEPINLDMAFLIHFRYKSTEEFINKYKRGYNNWLGDNINYVLKSHIEDYFEQNKITLEKINYIEKELKINLLYFRIQYYFSKLFLLDKISHIILKYK